MFRDIIIIFDDLKTCAEALAYGREFASRMDARTTLLMLIPMRFAGGTRLVSQRSVLNRIEGRAADLLSHALTPFLQQGLEVSSAIRVGEPGQELLKFLADRPPVQAMIWGSGTDLPGKGHWIARATGNMECPLLTVSKKM
jgi:hypothetical protein